MQTIDARGRACPEPVVMTRNALARDGSGAIVLVDDPCAIENITRYGQNHGYRVACSEQQDAFALALTKP